MAGRTPAKPQWSEVMIFLGVLLRRGSPCPEDGVCFDERGARRNWMWCRVAHLRRANAGRRRMFCGGPNSGEAVVVGGNNLFGSSPPVKAPSPELARRYAALNQNTQSVSNRGGLFFVSDFTSVNYCYILFIEREEESFRDENHNSTQFDGTDL